ncbi:MAG: hypothetical protein ACOCQD_01960 [archaeon]
MELKMSVLFCDETRNKKEKELSGSITEIIDRINLIIDDLFMKDVKAITISPKGANGECRLPMFTQKGAERTVVILGIIRRAHIINNLDFPDSYLLKTGVYGKV